MLQILLMNLWNDEVLTEILKEYSCVKAYFNGHNHAGNYGENAGIHYLTFKGMVDTPDQSAFPIVPLKNDTISVKGHGREVSRKLEVK